VALTAGGCRDKEIVQVTGKVRLVGSGVMPEIVISAEDKEWYVAREEMQKLHKLQQQTVTVEAKETIKEMKFANGRSAGIRRTLSDIKIISIQ
jgi:hypothetical protein